MSSNKYVTPEFRVSFPNVFEAKAFTGKNGEQIGDKKYSIVCIFDKKDTDFSNLEKAVEEAKKEGAEKKWGGKIPKKLRLPIRDGDEEEREELEGKWFCSMSRPEDQGAPGIIDGRKNDITDKNVFYGGCYARASFRAFAYGGSGPVKPGISFSLENIQKLRDGEPFGAVKANAQDDFEEVEMEDEPNTDFDNADIPF